MQRDPQNSMWINFQHVILQTTTDEYTVIFGFHKFFDEDKRDYPEQLDPLRAFCNHLDTAE